MSKGEQKIINSPPGDQVRENEKKKHEGELKDFIGKVNFVLLEKLFLDVAEKCGIEKAKLSMVNEADIVIGRAGLGSARFDSKKGKINRIKIESLFGSIDVYYLQTLIHEEAHAVSKNVCIGEVTEKSLLEEMRKTGEYPIWVDRGNPGYQQTGLWRSFNTLDESPDSPYKAKRDVFHLLNEALVERFSREITQQYLEADQNFDRDIVRKYREVISNKKLDLSYVHESALLESIIIKIASTAGMPERTVEQAFYRALLEGELFEDDEVVELFQKTFGPNFLNEIAKLKVSMFTGAKRTMREFADKYGLELDVPRQMDSDRSF